MHKLGTLSLDELNLDLGNFRTLPQPDEQNALDSMIFISPENFWALVDSIIQDGYLPQESLIVMEKDGRAIVMEGNRRTAALKLIFGLIKPSSTEIPHHTQNSIGSLTKEWKEANKQVPCLIYPSTSAAEVDKIIARTHGKGQKAGRDAWTAIAKARHNKTLGMTEAPLILLEKYFRKGKNISHIQRQIWSGDYPYTVAAEMMKRLHTDFDCNSSAELAENYPDRISKRDGLESILLAIGHETIGFKHLRSQDELEKIRTKYLGYRKPEISVASNEESAETSDTNGAGSAISAKSTSNTEDKGPESTPSDNGNKSAKPSAAASKSVSNQDSVKDYLKNIRIYGPGKSKAETIRLEMINLKIDKNPLAFTLLLRSFLEILAKAYAANRKDLSIKTSFKGNEVKLVAILGDIALKSAPQPASGDPEYNTKFQKNKSMSIAKSTLDNQHGILSVNAMNNIVHHGAFTIPVADLCREFHNIVALIDELVADAPVQAHSSDNAGAPVS